MIETKYFCDMCKKEVSERRGIVCSFNRFTISIKEVGDSMLCNECIKKVIDNDTNNK